MASHDPVGAAAAARPAGCAIAVDPSSSLPPGTIDVGLTRANCDRDRVSEAACLRALLDGACALGADRVYGVHDLSKVIDRRNLYARAVRAMPRP